MLTTRSARCLLLLSACAALAVECKASEVVFGVHTFSIHSPQRNQQNDNFGLYGRYGQWAAGGYRNSHDRNTFYGGYEFNLLRGQYGELGLLIGAASGYQVRCSTTATYVPAKVEIETRPNGEISKTTTPAQITKTESCAGFSRGFLTALGALSYAPNFWPSIPVRPRLSFMPGLGKTSSVYHLSIEGAF